MKQINIQTILLMWIFIILFVTGCEEVQKQTLDADFYINQGNAYVGKGQYDQAISDFNKAIQINPRFAKAYYNRGVAYKRKGQYDQAISDYNKAIEINPRDALAYYNRGIACFYAKKYEKAWDDAHKAQDLGYSVQPRFLKALREALGREK
ncbi:MAG: tetratricopeptide repeat protein [Deltaproteobacteria bacterium]|nr:tetratricopeptide repeat protein [Deltaproteobacteria bacterium]